VILVDTSVWIDHLRLHRPALRALLDEGRIRCHPFVIGELACGTLRNRKEILHLLGTLPTTDVVHHDEALQLVSTPGLAGSGLGWVDVHLLASARISGDSFWTLDLRLAAAARSLHVAEYRP
jgi:hypothetical protein